MTISSTKKLGLITGTSIVIGNMVASGVFMLPASLAMYGGISLIGWLIAGLGAIALALMYGWISQIMPIARGGPYAYTREGMGDFAGFLVAWGYWISVWCTNAALTIACVSYLSVFFPILSQNAFAAVSAGLAMIWFLTWINTLGVQAAGKVQVITTVMKIIPLALIGIGGLFYIDASHFIPFNQSELSDFRAIITTTTLTFFAFLGLECATIPSNEIENPEKNVSRSTVIGTLISTFIYVLTTIAVMGILPVDVLAKSNAPLADAANTIWGSWARNLVVGGAVISTFGALNGWILMQGQIPAAAAMDKLLPEIFAKENNKKTPYFSILLSSVLVSMLMIMNYQKSLASAYQFAILLSTLTVLVPYLFSIVSYWILSAKQKNKLNTLRVVITIFAFLFSIWAVIGCGSETVYWGFIMLMIGLPIYAYMKIKGINN